MYLIGYVPEWFVVSSSSKDLVTYENISETSSYIWILLPNSYLEWKAFLHLYLAYLLPKGRNFVYRYWTMFCLQELIISIGNCIGHTLGLRVRVNQSKPNT